MATRQKFKETTETRRKRHFSESFKRQKVSEIEKKITTIAEVSREYDVTANAIYNWISKYSLTKKKGVRVIVELESDTKKINELRNQVAELERLLGQKQVTIDFMEKVIDIAEDMYQVDVKKKFGTKPSYGTGSIEKK